VLITLDQAIDLAVAHNHSLKATRTLIAQNQAQEITANLRPNPTLNFDAQFVPIFSPSNFSSDNLDEAQQSSLAGLAHPAAVGLELSASHGPRLGAERREDPAVEAEALAGVKNKVNNQGRTIVFIDESGLSERRHRCRTWAPRGQTPMLPYHFNWKTLSAIAGVTWWNFYFRLFPGAIRSPQIIEFLTYLLRHVPGKLLIVWDGLPGHRSGAVWQFVQQ
jgi:DDE superfamily endonuclease